MPNEDYYKKYDQTSSNTDWLEDDEDIDYEDLYEE
jgi:hypothetical protein